MSDDRDVAVVIVNYRTKALTVEAVRSVLGERAVSQVVVVDNASGDGSVEYLTEQLSGTSPPVTVVRSEQNLGFGQGCEVGARSSSAPLLFFLNSDATALPGSLDVLREALLDDPRLGVVAPLVYEADGRTLQVDSHGLFPSLRTLLLRTNRRPPETLRPDWVSGVAMMMRRSDYDEVGGFDPAFRMYLEDVDLCRRLRASGKEVHRVQTAAVRHVGGASRRSRVDQRSEYHRSQRLYFQKAGAGPFTMVALRVISLSLSAPLPRRPDNAPR